MPVGSTRTANMELRRERILASARTLLAHQGVDALTVRDLAKHAGVTVPTLYNLIGSKEDILRLLIEDMVLLCEGALEEVRDRDPLRMAEHVVTTLARLFEENEDMCRAALRAGQHLEPRPSGASPGLLRRSAQISNQICLEAEDRGLLRGQIDPTRLAERAFDSYRIAAIDWLHDVIDAAGFRRNALVGFFVCLAADAKPAFREKLFTKIGEVEASRPQRSRTRRQGPVNKRSRRS